MKQFLAIYTGTAAAFEKWNALDEAERKQREETGIKAWMEWGETHANITIVEGGPLGKTKEVSPEGISDIRNNMTGFIIVQAETHEAAARLFENHPHFTIFPGDGVEIMECLPLPDMSSDPSTGETH